MSFVSQLESHVYFGLRNLGVQCTLEARACYE